MNNQTKEVEWYRKNGKHPTRIKHDQSGNLYVIGDWSWNKLHPSLYEKIEDRMKREAADGDN
jgi:hypothetical protein